MQKPSHLFEDSQQIHTNHVLNSILRKNPHLDAELIRNAYSFCVEAHSNQFRKSGMPYAEHPIEVAKVLAEYQVDSPTLIAGFLHDVVEDTDYTVEDIRSRFGEEVAFMVDAVSKITEIQEDGPEDKEARKIASLRKLLAGVVKDPRVLMIKIADRLHNMRTLHFVASDSKRRRISQETIEVYTPLAHRFGMSRIKTELDDLAFKYLHPEAYEELLKQLATTRDERETYIHAMVQELDRLLWSVGIKAQIQGRPKNMYSIWHKIRNRHSEIENIYDLFALRVIVPQALDCYTALGVIHQRWSPIQSRFKDYIACPKPNLYQSIHTTVLGPQDRMVEIQVRTPEMDQVAERGFAAHWSYKQKQSSETGWLEELLKHHSESEATEFYELLKLDLKSEDLVAYTPKGDEIHLPQGATILDFAYAVHTNLGHQCVGARIDDQYVPMDRALPYGSTVKVLRSAHQKPNREWATLARTTRAKTAIRRFLRHEEKSKFMQLGKTILEREYRLLGIVDEQPSLEFFNRNFMVHSWEELHEKLGTGEVPLARLQSQLETGHTFEIQRQESFVLNQASMGLVQFLPCCTPVPGDELLGVLTQGHGIAVHRNDCQTGLEWIAEHPNDQIPVVWDPVESGNYDVRIEVLGSDRELMLRDITEVFRTYHVSVMRAHIETTGDRVKNYFELKVHGLSQLSAAVLKLQELEGIEKVLRL